MRRYFCSYIHAALSLSLSSLYVCQSWLTWTCGGRRVLFQMPEKRSTGTAQRAASPHSLPASPRHRRPATDKLPPPAATYPYEYDKTPSSPCPVSVSWSYFSSRAVSETQPTSFVVTSLTVTWARQIENEADSVCHALITKKTHCRDCVLGYGAGFFSWRGHTRRPSDRDCGPAPPETPCDRSAERDCEEL